MTYKYLLWDPMVKWQGGGYFCKTLYLPFHIVIGVFRNIGLEVVSWIWIQLLAQLPTLMLDVRFILLLTAVLASCRLHTRFCKSDRKLCHPFFDHVSKSMSKPARYEDNLTRNACLLCIPLFPFFLFCSSPFLRLSFLFSSLSYSQGVFTLLVPSSYSSQHTLRKKVLHSTFSGDSACHK